jgi:hypothetical protein
MVNPNTHMVIAAKAPAASPCPWLVGVAETLGFGSGPTLAWRSTG